MWWITNSGCKLMKYHFANDCLSFSSMTRKNTYGFFAVLTRTVFAVQIQQLCKPAVSNFFSEQGSHCKI